MTQPIPSVTDELGGSIQIELAPDEPEQTVSEPTTPDVETPTTPVSEPVQETPVPVLDDESNFIKLDKRSIAQEIARLKKEDPETANSLFSIAGRHTAETYQAQLEEERFQRQELQKEMRRREILALSDEEIESKFASDSVFALEYAEAVHRDPNAAARVLEDRRNGRALLNTIYSAVDYGLPDEKAQEIHKALSEGAFDVDKNGKIHTLVEVQSLVQAVILKTINETKVAAATTPAAPVAEPPKANPALNGSGPDTSTTGIVKSKVGASSLDSYHQALAEDRYVPPEEIDRLVKAKYNL